LGAIRKTGEIMTGTDDGGFGLDSELDPDQIYPPMFDPIAMQNPERSVGEAITSMINPTDERSENRARSRLFNLGRLLSQDKKSLAVTALSCVLLHARTEREAENCSKPLMQMTGSEPSLVSNAIKHGAEMSPILEVREACCRILLFSAQACYVREEIDVMQCVEADAWLNLVLRCTQNESTRQECRKIIERRVFGKMVPLRRLTADFSVTCG
jgi:hypothetical protein